RSLYLRNSQAASLGSLLRVNEITTFALASSPWPMPLTQSHSLSFIPVRHDVSTSGTQTQSYSAGGDFDSAVFPLP
ncbi:MAG: hypothetical protein ABR568_23875, partial [Pyrinomonadaceae bacterium]